MVQGLTAVVFAGGTGRRFSPFTTNKTIVPFAGKPLVQRVIESLAGNGIKEIVVVTSPESDLVVKNLQIPEISIRTIIQEKPTGQGDAMILAGSLIGSRPALVVNATCFAEEKFYAQVVARTDSGKPFIAAIEREEYFPGGYVIEQNGRAVSIVEKPSPNDRPSRLINLVFHFFPNLDEIVQLVKNVETNKDDKYEQALASFMVREEVGIERYSGIWFSMKTPLSVLDITEALLLRMSEVNIDPTATVSPMASIQGPVTIAAGAHVFAGAVIIGPSYIGENVLVGQSCLVRNSLVEKNTEVGFGTEVCRSYVGPGCKLHHAYVGDSVLEKDVRMAQGVCTANLRFDKQPVLLNLGVEKMASNRLKLGVVAATGVEFGVQSCSMPGTCMSAGVVVYPQSQVRGFVPVGAKVGKNDSQQTINIKE